MKPNVGQLARCGVCFSGASLYNVETLVSRAVAVNSTVPKKQKTWLNRIWQSLNYLGRLGLMVTAQLLLPPTWTMLLRGGLLLGSVVKSPMRGLCASMLPSLVLLRSYMKATSIIAPAHSRSLQFWTRVIPIYMGYKYTQVVTPMLSEERQRRAWRKRHEWGAEKVYRLCVDLRGFYLKDGQFIGSRADFIPEEWAKKLQLLQDQVPPVQFDKIERCLRSDLKINDAHQILQAVEERPLASATIAQVHRGVTKTGNHVVLKVQYDDQESLMELDLRNLRNLALFLQNNDMKFFDLLSVVTEFETQIPLEFDFEEEARLMRTISNNLQSAGISPSKVIIPELEEGMSSRRVLTMQYIRGVRVDDTKTIRRWNVDLKTVTRNIGEAFGRMMLVDGLFHADPHPGNILVLPDGRVGLIDFGQCKRIDDRLRLQLCAFFLSMNSKDPNAVAKTFLELGIVLDIPYEEDHVRSNYLISIYANGLFDTGPLPDGIEINPFAETSPLREVPVTKFPPELFMVLRTMGLLRALCVTVGVELAMSDVFRPYALAALRTADASLKSDVLIPRSSTRPKLVQKTIVRISELLYRQPGD